MKYEYDCQVFYSDGTIEEWHANTLESAIAQVDVQVSDYDDALNGRVIRFGRILYDYKEDRKKVVPK